MKEIVLENSAAIPIDLHWQPSQNGAQLYSGCDVSVITGLIKIFSLKVNWSIVCVMYFILFCFISKKHSLQSTTAIVMDPPLTV